MEDNIEKGDYVKIKYDAKEVEGILMPRAGIMSKDITVLKLDNGYNIGIKNSRIKKITLIEKYKLKAQKKSEIKQNQKLPNVSVLSFGGTISSKIDYRTGGVYADYTAEDFINMEPELRNIANIKAKHVLSIMSEDASWQEWKTIAESIYNELKDKNVNGIVCTVGTDTMHYITAAVSFFLKNLNKPVIFTAAQRSIDRASSDAFMNLKCAITAAAKFNAAEVMTCMHATINDDFCFLIRGTKVRKMHSSRRDAFRPINEKPFAKIYADGKTQEINSNYKKIEKHKSYEPELDLKYNDKIALIMIHPGIDKDIIDYYISKGYKGIVLATTGMGHVPSNTKNNLMPSIQSAANKGIPIIIATQTIYGRTHPHVYTGLRKLSIESGCIFAEDMLPEVAYVKLGYVLGHTAKIQDIKKQMSENLRGEINSRHMSDEFLY
ncbi:MAG: Glu-tRNA(Gln) amidotransferase subunit GatD [Candidatus Woesearchaeota archaeon]